MSRQLPDFPWDALAPYGAAARAHADGIVDLSVGTPVDPVPGIVQDALTGAADSPGYPLTIGTERLREAAQRWMTRKLGVVAPVSVLPTVGSKELVALLAWLLEAPGPVAFPALAYPTYEVGAILAGREPVRLHDGQQPPTGTAMVWLNSPSNPTGAVRTAAELRQTVEWARSTGALVVSDECYLELGWEGPTPVSVLHPSVCGDSHRGILAVHSLSKRSNFAGYRCGLVAGDPGAITRLTEIRKHAGLMVPAPVQAAAAAALDDDAHVQLQRARYERRRSLLRSALHAAGFTIEHSQAGLYVWATRGESCWDTVKWMSDRGILVAPGSFYGPSGDRHVRVALTATDERISAAVERLTH